MITGDMSLDMLNLPEVRELPKRVKPEPAKKPKKRRLVSVVGIAGALLGLAIVAPGEAQASDAIVWAAKHLGKQANGAPKTLDIEPSDATCYTPRAIEVARIAAIEYAEQRSGTVTDRAELLAYLESVETINPNGLT